MKIPKAILFFLLLLPFRADAQKAAAESPVKAGWQIDSVSPKPGQRITFNKELIPNATDFRNYMLDLAFYYYDVNFAFHVDSSYRGYTFNSDLGKLFSSFLDSQPYPGQFVMLHDTMLSSDSFYIVVTQRGTRHQGIDTSDLRSGQWEFFNKQQLADSNWIKQMNQMLLDTNISLELMCFTDCRNTAEYNKELSQKVADGIKNLMFESGLDAWRIIPIGMGETIIFNKRCRCEGPTEFTRSKQCTEEQHQMNRKMVLRLKIKNGGEPYGGD